jgi:hypothetical protein
MRCCVAATMTTSPSLFDRALTRLRRTGGAALAGGAMLQLPAQLGCAVEDAQTLGEAEQADWAQYEGVRDTSMVSYTGDSWSICRQPNTRFGCGALDLIVKLRVKPVAGADLNWKRVGVVYRTPFDPTERTAMGNYVTTWSDGYEEWHVAMSVAQWSATVLFDAWYQDGAGHTYFDDNMGELHVAHDGPPYQVVRVEPWQSTVVVGDAGVQGKLSLQALDLDYDKQLEIHATKDGWTTVLRFGIGNPGDKNRWYWVEKYPWSGRERWEIDLDLPGAADSFEYAVVYRHGVVNNARTTEFWDNNFQQNYRVDRAPE